MTWPMYEELKDICDSIAKNPEIRVAIFRGAGDKAFVSGSDIQQFVDLQEDEAYETAVDDIFHSLQHLPIPTIALNEGLAVGSGLLIATSCDFRIATPDARFGIPIARTLGNCLSPSNLAWISAHLGMPMVKKMLLTLARLLQSNLPDCTDLMRETYNSKDFKEGVSAFLEGRPPNWIGI